MLDSQNYSTTREGRQSFSVYPRLDSTLFEKAAGLFLIALLVLACVQVIRLSPVVGPTICDGPARIGQGFRRTSLRVVAFMRRAVSRASLACIVVQPAAVLDEEEADALGR